MQSNISISGAVAGVSFNGNLARTADGGSGYDPTIPAAKSGTLSTRTDNDTGTLTLASGHGITTGATIDLYWDGGRRYNVTVGTVSGTSVPIDLGAGDNLPAQGTAVTATLQTGVDVDFDGDLLQLIIARCTNKGIILFYESSSVAVVVDLAANEPYLWASGWQGANPFAGVVVDEVKMSQGGTSDQAIRLGVLLDAA